jgi:hypothetical protein
MMMGVWAAKRVLIGVAFGVMSISMSASADEIVIIESTAPLIEAGVILDSADVVNVPDGTEIVIVEEDGSSRTITGPYNAPISAAGSSSSDQGLIASIGKLVEARKTEQQVLGAIRAAPGQIAPNVYAIDIARSRTVCIPSNTAPTLWRPATLALESEISVTRDADGAVDTRLWPKGEQSLSWPDNPKAKDGERYTIRLRALPRPSKIDVRVIPPSITSFAEKSSWMFQQGCRRQAERLLASRDQKQ